MNRPSKIVFLLFDGFLELDFIGPFDIVHRIRDSVDAELAIVVVGQRDHVKSANGLSFTVDKTLAETGSPANSILVVPGGRGARKIFTHGNDVIESYLRDAAAEESNIVASVCTGALILARIGILKGKRATTHKSAFELLRPHVKDVVEERVVEDGNVVTAAGVTAGIDLGLYLAEKYYGKTAADEIASRMEYRR